MILVGLTGGIACGKSTVSELLENQYNIQIIDADLIVKKLQEPNSSCTRRIANRWPECVHESTGALDRAALGRIVFADAQARKELGRIMNGPIMRAILWEIWKAWWNDAFRQFFQIHTGAFPNFANDSSHVVNRSRHSTHNFISNDSRRERTSHDRQRVIVENEYEGKIVILDAPTLFETSFFTHFIASSLVIACSEKTQIRRLMQRSALSESEALERIRAQMPLDEKRRRAGYVIENERDNDNFHELQLAVADSVMWMSTLSGMKLTMIITGVVIGCTTALTAAARIVFNILL